MCTTRKIFQLTPSRRATFIMRHSINDLIISTHALTEGDRQSVDPGHLALISTHALTEGDVGCFYISFFSPISTHALTEGDKSRRMEHGIRKNFNSRPHGGRLCVPRIAAEYCYFNSRPHGGRRAADLEESDSCGISTHALTEGDTLNACSASLRNFNSRPHGGRLFYIFPRRFSGIFQLTPSRRATRPSFQTKCRCCYFNSRPHGGRPD